MPNIKNNEIATHILQKLFIYKGEDDFHEEKKTVTGFCSWLPSCINPVTKKPFEPIHDVTMYKYIRGEQVPSWDILYAVSLYFTSPLLSQIMNIAPWPGQTAILDAKIHDAEEEAEKAIKKVKELKTMRKKFKL